MDARRFILLATFIPLLLRAGEVRPIRWSTDSASPAAKLQGEREHLLPLIRLGVSTLPEPQVMQLTFLGGSALGLPPGKALELQSLLSGRYRAIEKDETFSSAPSALAYCYSESKPGHGFATVYLPASVSHQTKTIVFLHGYGGSFLFYLHYLATIFPDHPIVCPAWGISCAHIPDKYLDECLRAAQKEAGISLAKPVLLGLSAGGFGGFREYFRKSAPYAGFICLGAFPPKKVLDRCPSKGRIHLLAGADEPFVKVGTLLRSGHSLRRRTQDYSSHLISDEGHFFMLSSEEETRSTLQKWSSELFSDE